ncbi:MAG: DMT family transporter [bacterium]|nr:DMT family transporter [bacterium]
MHRFRADFFLLMCTVLWGGTFLAIKLVIDTTPPMFLVAVRFSLAALIYLLVFHRAIARASRRDVRRGIVLGLFLLGGFGLQTLGLQYTSIARSAFITQLIVLFTPALQWLLFRRLPRPATLAGIAIVLVGMYFLTSPGGEAQLNRGDWLTLGCAISFSLYIVFVDRYGTRENAAALSFDQTLFVAAFAWLIAVGFEFPQFPDSPRLDLFLGLLFLAPFGTNLVVYWQTRWQPETTPARAAVIFAMEPVFATTFAVLFAQEVLPARAALGAAIIFAGMLVSELGPVIGARRSAAVEDS